MKWQILLELTETTGSVETREMVTGDRPTNVISPESIGLSLAESKSNSRRDKDAAGSRSDISARD